MKKAIIIGASSGIGYEMAKVLSKKGYSVGITARRTELLEELAAELPGESFVRAMDVEKADEAIGILHELIDEMGGLDMIVISAGMGRRTEDKIDWESEKQQIGVNVVGFAAMAAAAFNYFLDNGGGYLAGISSVAMLRGNRINPVYSASKAFVSTYLEGLRLRAAKLGVPVKVIDVRPGFIDTAMDGSKDLKINLSAPTDKAAREMVAAIERGKRVAYVPAIWKGTEIPYRAIPSFIYEKF